MTDYIRRNDALEIIKRTSGDYAAAFAEIRKLPSADVAEVVHGQWISFLDGDHIMPERYYRCSRCGRVESRRQPYCHCGAKMENGVNK